jgi:spermidine synthase
MIGATEKISIDYQQIRQRLLQPRIAPVLAAMGIRSVGELLARQYLFSDQSLTRFAAGAPLNTDDKPILEYSAHHILGRNALGAYTEPNLEALMQTMQQENPPLVGLGSNITEITEALKDLGRSYVRQDKQSEGNLFLKQAELFRPKL